MKTCNHDVARVGDMYCARCGEPIIWTPEIAKKPPAKRQPSVLIGAVQWTGDNLDKVKALIRPQEPRYMHEFADRDEILGLATINGFKVAKKDDWVLLDIDGMVHVEKPETFALMYELKGDTWTRRPGAPA